MLQANSENYASRKCERLRNHCLSHCFAATADSLHDTNLFFKQMVCTLRNYVDYCLCATASPLPLSTDERSWIMLQVDVSDLGISASMMALCSKRTLKNQFGLAFCKWYVLQGCYGYNRYSSGTPVCCVLSTTLVCCPSRAMMKQTILQNAPWPGNQASQICRCRWLLSAWFLRKTNLLGVCTCKHLVE